MKRALLLALCLCACGLPSAPQRLHYKLNADNISAMLNYKKTQPAQYTLRVDTPTAAFGLGGERIQVQTSDGKIAAVDNAGWAQPLGAMLQPIVLRAFEQSGTVARVVDDRSSRTAQRSVKTHIERFIIARPDAKNPDLRVEADIRMELTSLPDNGFLKAKRCQAQEKLEPLRMHKVVAAFEKILAKCLSEQVGALTGKK
jgi:ABC-type uncharacterized transport system auxiliary subunit